MRKLLDELKIYLWGAVFFGGIYGLTLFKGEWYLAGFDNDRDAVRVFKVRRMSAISLHGKQNSYAIPDTFDISALFQNQESEQTLSVGLKVRKDRAQSLRTYAVLKSSSGDF